MNVNLVILGLVPRIQFLENLVLDPRVKPEDDYLRVKPEDDYLRVKPEDDYLRVKPEDDYLRVKPEDDYLGVGSSENRLNGTYVHLSLIISKDFATPSTRNFSHSLNGGELVPA